MFKSLVLFILIFPAIAISQTQKWDVPATGILIPEPGQNKPEVDEKFMPPLVSQDTLGICYASAASTVLNYEMCKRNSMDCKSLPDSKRISSLGISRYSAPPKNKEENFDESYDKMKLGGSGAELLSMATDVVPRLPNQDCSSLEKITSKDIIRSSGEATAAQEAVWRSLQSDYEHYRKALRDKCDDCASKYYQSATETVSKNLKLEEDEKADANTRNDSLRVMEAFKQDTYEKALNSLLYPPKCSERENLIKFPGYGVAKTDYFPKTKTKVAVPKLLEEIKKILLSKKPVLLEDLCIQDCKTADPKLHAVVIAGYRRICPKENSDPTKCRISLKVVNSWGAGWQKENNGGWVESEPLLSSVKVDKASLSWLADK